MREIAPQVWASFAGRSGWGWSNAALVAGDDGTALAFDAGFTLEQGRALQAAASGIAPAGVRVLVYSHANADHTWGSAALSECEVIASDATALELPGEITPEAMRQQMAVTDPAPGSGAAYLQEHFSNFDFAGVTGPRPPTRTFSGELEISVGGRAVELICVGPAHTRGDVIAHVPDAGVVMAGDILFIGDHPVSWGAPLTGWVAALERLLATGARWFVPGHGPLVGRSEVEQMRAYTLQVAEYAASAAAAGRPLLEAAAAFPAERYPWGLAERLVSLMAAGYRAAGVEEDALPQLGMVGLIASHCHALTGTA